MYDGCILPRKYYAILYASSYLSVLSVIYACYREYYICASIPGSVFITSITYWQYPDYSWRRTLDITVVRIALILNCVIAWWSQNGNLYYGITLFSIVLFITGRILYIHGYVFESVLLHAGLHLVANIANLVLYSGEITIL